MNPFPKVGIIYLTFATPEWARDISRGLASLEKIAYPKDRLELICVESKSSAGSVEEWFQKEWMPRSGVTLPRITYIHKDEVIGFAGNNNIGYVKAKELGCDYVYLLNQDAEADPDFLAMAVERAERDSKVAYVQSLILLGDDKNKVNTVGNAFHFLGFGYSNGYLWTREQATYFFAAERAKNPDLEIGYFSGAGVLGRISTIDQCGLFDDRFFMYHEDMDATFQARMRGYKTVVEPSSIIYHYYDFSKSIKKFFWMERNRWVVLFSYLRPWTLFLLFPMLIAMELGSFFFALRGGWWREKLRVYRELLGNDFWKWVQSRLIKIQKERVISDREFMKYAVATIEFQGEAIKSPLLTYVANPLMKAYWAVVRIFVW